MRSKTPQRSRPALSHRTSRKRSRSDSSPDIKSKSQKRSGKTGDRNDGRSARRTENERKDSVDRQKPQRKHSSRHQKDSSESEREQKKSVRRDASRKRSRSPRHRSKRSRSRSLDKKISRGVGHVRKHGLTAPRSSDHGMKSSLPHSRGHSGSRKGSRSPRQKRKTGLDKDQGLTEQLEKKKPDREGLEMSELQKRIPPKKRLDQTDFSLNERFSQFYDGKPPVLDESISIEIERNVDGDEPFVIPNFHPHEVLLPHRFVEDHKPLSSRREFMSARGAEQDEDKRVVTVTRSFNREPGYKLGLAARSGNDGANCQPTLFWKDMGRDTIVQVPIVTSERVRESETEVTSASDHLGQRVVQSRRDNEQRPETSRSRTREGQHFPQSRDDVRMRLGRGQDQDLRTFRGDNRNYEPFGRRRPFDKFRSKVTSVVHGVKLSSRDEKPNATGIREEDRGQPAELPDFSRRPDKYTYDIWMDKPEMIPKGRSYFEHDNRSEDNAWDMNRGRGKGGFTRGSRGRGFAVRGMQRFPNTSFRKRSGSVESLQWKHDKFETLEDEKPSSTTEK